MKTTVRFWVSVGLVAFAGCASFRGRVNGILESNDAKFAKCSLLSEEGRAGKYAGREAYIYFRLGEDGRISEKPVITAPGREAMVEACLKSRLEELSFPTLEGRIVGGTFSHVVRF